MTAALDGRRASTWRSSPRPAWKSLNPIAELEQEPNMPAGHLASMFNAQGPNANCLTACAASSQAIGEAVEIIRRGDADVMLSGGTHSMIHPFGVTGFNLLTALSHQQRRPDQGLAAVRSRSATASCWAKGRRWSCWKSWNTPSSAARQIYGEVIGYGSTADAFRITDTHPEGRGAIACMQDGDCTTPGSNADGHPLHQRPRHQHRRSTTRSKRWPSRRSSASTPTRCPSPAPRA